MYLEFAIFILQCMLIADFWSCRTADEKRILCLQFPVVMDSNVQYEVRRTNCKFCGSSCLCNHIIKKIPTSLKLQTLCSTDSM